MNERFAVVAARIRQELMNLERVVARVERAMAAARRHPEDQDIYLDSVALNLHDFYAGLERILHFIAANVDRSVPSGREGHRELLLQMSVVVPQVRPQVLSTETVEALDEYLRFRHVVRNVYAFEFDLERVQRMVQRLPSTLERVRAELSSFAEFLEGLAQDG